MDGTGINAGNRDHPASVMHPPTKRHKLYAFLVHPMCTHMYYGYFDIVVDFVPRKYIDVWSVLVILCAFASRKYNHKFMINRNEFEFLIYIT